MAAYVQDGIGVASDASAGGGGSSFSVDVGVSGQYALSRVMLAFAFMRSNSSSPSVTSMTCGGVAMTKWASASLVNQYNTGQWINVEVWYLLMDPPAAGPGNVVVAGSYNMTLPQAGVTMATTVLNVNPRGWQGQAATASGSSTNPTVMLYGMAAGSNIWFAAAQQRGASGGSYDSSAAHLLEAYDAETGTGSAGDLTYYMGYAGPTGGGNGYFGPTRSSSAPWTAVAVELLKSEEGIPLGAPMRRRQMALVRF